MAVWHDWFCAEHGDFEGSHPICPNYGCESKEVIRVYKKAPGFKSDMTKRTDAGLRGIADSYHLSDLKSGKEGDVTKPRLQGEQVLWGKEAQDFVRTPLTQAHVPQTFNVADPKTGAKKEWTDQGGMRNMAAIGLTERVLPVPAETISEMKRR